ncbi:MAG: helix-turn-helix transcriptional regulator [Subtercola sp.]|nr:helix-turn-helix transcriptional regulator [Subtercola sp.]
MSDTPNRHQTDDPDSGAHEPALDNVVISDELKRLRERLGISQIELGRRVNRSRSVISNAESGREFSRFLLDELRKLDAQFSEATASYSSDKWKPNSAQGEDDNDAIDEMFLLRSASVAAVSGDWFALWETTVNMSEVLNVESIEINALSRNRIQISNKAISEDNEEGGYLWTSECRFFDNQYLLGTYIALDKATRSKGSLQLALHRSGKYIEGQWIGCNYDFEFANGLVVMARDPDHLRGRMEIHRNSMKNQLS